MKKRIDLYLVENGHAKSRERAKDLIKNGAIKINGKTIKKASLEVSDNDVIKVLQDDLEFVGRGALKLEKAFSTFKLDVHKKVCADIGASTGGFTQIMINNGAQKVYAIDVGHDQLDEKLKDDFRVKNCEGINVRFLEPSFFDEPVEFMSVDLSFISLNLVMKVLFKLLDDDGEMVVLIKPQFEAGKKALNKKGVVKNKKDHILVLTELISYFEECGFCILDLVNSAITGGEGNIEYLAHLKKTDEIKSHIFDVKNIVNNSFDDFKN